MKSQYLYNNRNLLKKKESYMYTPYAGMTFVKNFIEKRKIYLLDLEIESDKSCLFLTSNQNKYTFKKFFQKNDNQFILEKLISKKIFNKKVKIDNLKNFYFKKNIRTEELIDYLTISILLKHNSTFINDTIEQLLKKFEINKKLHISYNNFQNKFLKSGNFTKSSLIYIKLSLLFALYYMKSKDIRFLNVLLKVNDLVTSIDSKINEKYLGLVHLSLSAELFFIKIHINKYL